MGFLPFVTSYRSNNLLPFPGRHHCQVGVTLFSMKRRKRHFIVKGGEGRHERPAAQFVQEDDMSKLFKTAVFAAIMGSLAISPAWADRDGHRSGVTVHRSGGVAVHRSSGHGHNAVGWGLGILAGTAIILAATSQPRVYHPPVVVERVYVPPPVMAPAPVYVRQQSYWYYCAPAGGYYPYVSSCPATWMKVLPN